MANRNTGSELVWVLLVNAGAIATLIGLAYLLGWLKSEPWRSKTPRPPVAAEAGSQTPANQPSARAAE